jgi:hypothetical protein
MGHLFIVLGIFYYCDTITFLGSIYEWDVYEG